MGDYMFMLESHLSAGQYRVVGQMRELASEAGVGVFLTGGAMRDTLGGFPVRDLDFTVEGSFLKLAKLAETTYRDVNIGLANQFARFAAENTIDIYEVIEASNSQPYSHIHRPGIAVGGHCIPVYPRLYLWNDPHATVVRAAREANADMPAYTVGLLEGAYGDLKGARVVVLGAAYRGGVKETAFSGVFPTVQELIRRGAQTSVQDPMYTVDELAALGLTAYEPGSTVDAAVLQADHIEYLDLRPADLPGIRVLVDGRCFTDPADWAGVTHRVVGRSVDE